MVILVGEESRRNVAISWWEPPELVHVTDGVKIYTYPL